MTIGEAQRLSEQMLGSVGISSKRLDSVLLLEHICEKPRAWLYSHADENLDDKVASRFFDLVKHRRDRTPLVHLTNKREFFGLELYIDNRVLTPRVETEKMAEWAVKDAPMGSSLIDIGTGSGALAIAIKKHRPDLEVVATDISDKALEVAKINADTHNAEIKFVQSNLWEAVDGKFSTVVTNLPYLQDDADLMPEVKKEPGVALFGGKDGLDLYRIFLDKLNDHLEAGGLLFTECDPWQHDSLTSLVSNNGLMPYRNDYFILGFREIV
jgi:release factor glutamine methyltransferase